MDAIVEIITSAGRASHSNGNRAHIAEIIIARGRRSRARQRRVPLKSRARQTQGPRARRSYQGAWYKSNNMLAMKPFMTLVSISLYFLHFAYSLSPVVQKFYQRKTNIFSRSLKAGRPYMGHIPLIFTCSLQWCSSYNHGREHSQPIPTLFTTFLCIY